tara:strand:+ start:426 stop:1295 length:870 start_codon:yes stop_codon:yes gene_type:complete
MAVGTHALVSLADLKTYLGVTGTADDVILEKCIDRATAIIESHCDRKLKARTFHEFLMPEGDRTVKTEEFPIVSLDTIAFGSQTSFSITSDTAATDVVATVGFDGTTLRLYKVASDGTETIATLSAATYATTSAVVSQINSGVSGWSATLTKNAYTRSLYRFGGRGVIDAQCLLDFPRDNVSEYRVDFETGRIHITADRFPGIRSDDAQANRFPAGFFPVFVQYTAGFETVPDDLQQVGLEVAGDIFRERLQDRTLSAESLGDYSYTQAAIADLLAERVAKLDHYKEIR